MRMKTCGEHERTTNHIIIISLCQISSNNNLDTPPLDTIILCRPQTISWGVAWNMNTVSPTYELSFRCRVEYNLIKFPLFDKATAASVCQCLCLSVRD